MATVLMPLPDQDFDVTETAVPWKVLTRAGHRVIFATERGGSPPACDPLLLTGVLFGQLGAEPEPRAFYAEMSRSPEFQAPIAWDTMNVADFDALWLPGGHAPGMRQYLGHAGLQEQVRRFFALNRPVAAICHGVLVAARAGVLAGRRTTCLPAYMELSGWAITAWKLGRYYRTYDQTVQSEVTAALARPEDFVLGPISLFSRDTDQDERPAFVVEDGLYLSGRWPGDAYTLSKRLLTLLKN